MGSRCEEGIMLGALRPTRVARSGASLGPLKPIVDICANWYADAYGRQLKKYGLRFEYVETPELKEALTRLPPAELEGRSMRYKRAIDLSFKKSYLPAHMQEAHDPFVSYIAEPLKKVEAEVWEQKEWEKNHRPM